MSFVMCEDQCEYCATHFVKDPLNSGDYNREGALQRFCPKCGRMLPLIDGDRLMIQDVSHSVMGRAGVRIAKTHGLDYKEMDDVIENLKKFTDRREFVHKLAFELNRIFELKIQVKYVYEFV